MPRGRNIGRSVKGTIHDRWSNKKRALFEARDDLLRLIGSEKAFAAIQNDWTSVAASSVGTDKPNEQAIRKRLEECHRYLEDLRQIIRAHPCEALNYDGLTDAEREALRMPR